MVGVGRSFGRWDSLGSVGRSSFHSFVSLFSLCCVAPPQANDLPFLSSTSLLQSLLAHLSPPPHLSPFYPALYAPAFGEPAFFDDSSFLAFASSFPGDDTAAGGKTQRRRGGGGLWSVFQPNYNHGGVAMDGGDGGWEGEDRPPEVPPPWRG